MNIEQLSKDLKKQADGEPDGYLAEEQPDEGSHEICMISAMINGI